MSAQLGVGVRVSVAWLSAGRFEDPDARLRFGRITDGPLHVPPGAVPPPMVSTVPICPGTWWCVLLEGDTEARAVHERALVPIDDGDASAEPLEHRREVEA